MSLKKKLQSANVSASSKPARKKAAKKKTTKKKAAKKATTRKKGSTDFAMELIESTSSVKGVKACFASDADSLADVMEWIPTGFEGLDEIFGGGWHVGRISEVFGSEGSGKSALAHRAIVGCQKAGGYVVYLDFEHSLEKRIFNQIGIDPKRLVYVEPQYIEQGADILVSALDKLASNPPDAPVLFVWDSVGASLPKVQFESEAGDLSPGAKARAVGNMASKLYSKVPLARAHVMLINQERTVFGGGGGGWGGPQYETTGGKSAKYAFSLRVRCARVATVKAGGNTGPACGYLIRATTKKNKCAPPHQSATWYLDFKHGPSPDLTMYHVLKDANKIRSVGGGKYTGPWADGVKFGKGDAWLEALKAEDGLRTSAEAAYLEIVRAGGARALLKIEEGGANDE